jgi:hypothetical protein
VRSAARGIGLTAEVGGFARLNHGLTTVVTFPRHRVSVETSKESASFRLLSGGHLRFFNIKGETEA